MAKINYGGEENMKFFKVYDEKSQRRHEMFERIFDTILIIIAGLCIFVGIALMTYITNR